MKKLGCLILFISMITGCIQTRSSEDGQSLDSGNEVSQNEEVISLFGVALPPIELSEREEAIRTEKLEEALKNYQAKPDSIDEIIWYGRRLAYLGRYNKAIQVFTQGLDKNPDSYKLLRHRGHRYITIRQFDKAIEDLQKAAFYSRRFENSPEPDGIPNRLGKPLSNDKFNIWYHLGIAYYLRGNYDKAVSSFKKCLTFCDNEDLLVATSDWFYMTYRKIGNTGLANDLLSKITNKMEVVERRVYLDRLMLYKGVYSPDALLDEAERANESLEPNLGYGVGNWYLYNGNVNISRSIFEQVLRNNNWDSFGYIAAEVELVNLRNL